MVAEVARYAHRSTVQPSRVACCPTKTWSPSRTGCSPATAEARRTAFSQMTDASPISIREPSASSTAPYPETVASVAVVGGQEGEVEVRFGGPGRLKPVQDRAGHSRVGRPLEQVLQSGRLVRGQLVRAGRDPYGRGLRVLRHQQPRVPQRRRRVQAPHGRGLRGAAFGGGERGAPQWVVEEGRGEGVHDGVDVRGRRHSCALWAGGHDAVSSLPSARRGRCPRVGPLHRPVADCGAGRCPGGGPG